MPTPGNTPPSSRAAFPLFTNHEGFRDRMRIRGEHSLGYRLTELRSATKFGGALLTIVGLGWFAMGLGSAI
jgi:hypothetical protein